MKETIQCVQYKNCYEDYLIEFANAKALGLNSKNKMKWQIISLLKSQYLLYLLHSYKICLLDLMGYIPHRQLKSSWGKNLNLYPLIGAWFMIALVTLTYKELKWPKYFIQELPLAYQGSIRLLPSSYKSRKCCPFKSEA